MRRAFFLCTRALRQSSIIRSNLNPIPHSDKLDYIPKFPLVAFPSSNFSFSSSSGNDSTIENPNAPIDNEPALPPKTQLVDTENSKEEKAVDNKDELNVEPLNDVNEAGDDVQSKTASNKIFRLDEKKLDELIKEATVNGFLADIRECEEILEDMVTWDKLLPDNIKKRVEAKFNEIGDKVQQGELGVEEGYELFKEFEDQMVEECKDLMDAEGPPQFNETDVPDTKEDSDDPPGEGPILRWHTFVVMAPGVDARHPKNKKVKMSVTVKELGLSKHQFHRFRELVGKRYHSGKDELTIVSERFEHREENRKDCLRTLLNIIEEAGKADKLVMDALTSHLKEKLKSNPHFMGRLNAKKTGILASNAAGFSSSSSRPFSSKASDPIDAGIVSNEELKKQIEKMYNGDDEEAFSTVFESILQRKLAGTSDQLDAEFLRDLSTTSRAYNSEDDDTFSDSY